MRIVCENWQEGLAYFLDPRVIAKMKRVGLSVARMDWRNKTVILSCDDDERYAAIVEGLNAVEMSEAETTPISATSFRKSSIGFISILQIVC